MAQKQIQDLQLRDDFDDTVNLPGDDGVQTYRVTGAQIKAHVLSSVSSLSTEVVTADKDPMQVNKRYIINKAGSQCVLKLPAVSSVGDQIEIVGLSANYWKVVTNASASAQLILDGALSSSSSSSSSIDVYMASSAAGCVRFVCTVANSTWVVLHANAANLGIITSFTGGDSTATSGNYKVVTFNNSGSLVVSAGAALVEYLMVGGGGCGGSGVNGNCPGAGGGGGGVLTGSAMVTPGTYAVSIGDGGIVFVGDYEGKKGGDGGNTTWNGLTALGGGGGASLSQAGGNGGSGGGGVYNTAKGNGTAGPPRQGYDGGAGSGLGEESAGGGGAGAAGSNPVSGTGGAGGAGVSSSITGSALYYGAGGGGGAYQGKTAGAGGSSGIGGAGGAGSNTGTAGTANRGGGGGGGGSYSTGYRAGGVGGKGVVILKFRFQ